jgi:23S rRNA pseudouridine955/2504/2580 synthase
VRHPDQGGPRPLTPVRLVTVDERGDGQRLDNFVLRECAAVPKTRLYRAIRKGEVRVNKGRAQPSQRLALGDVVRLPPLAVPEEVPPSVAPAGWQGRLAKATVLEDEDLLVLNKPSGLAVHGGSGLQFGLIETLRAMRPELRYLELVHRLDRETSGLILVAKKPRSLKALHALLREEGGIDKRYLALVAGQWPRHMRLVDAPLERIERKSGERMVRVSVAGKSSRTAFRIESALDGCTLVEAKPLTGRTHQIRVHAQHAGCAVLGDDKYANDLSRSLADQLRLKRLFLHARALRFKLGGQTYDLAAELDQELNLVLARAGA